MQKVHAIRSRCCSPSQGAQHNGPMRWCGRWRRLKRQSSQNPSCAACLLTSPLPAPLACSVRAHPGVGAGRSVRTDAGAGGQQDRAGRCDCAGEEEGWWWGVGWVWGGVWGGVCVCGGWGGGVGGTSLLLHPWAWLAGWGRAGGVGEKVHGARQAGRQAHLPPSPPLPPLAPPSSSPCPACRLCCQSRRCCAAPAHRPSTRPSLTTTRMSPFAPPPATSLEAPAWSSASHEGGSPEPPHLPLSSPRVPSCCPPPPPPPPAFSPPHALYSPTPCATP